MTANITIYRLFIAGLLCVLSIQSRAQINIVNSSGCSPLLSHFSLVGNYQSFNWTFSNGTTSTASNPAVLFTAPGAYSVTVTAFNASNANNSNQTFTLANVVTVSSTPIPQMSVSADSICLGDTVSFSVQNPNAGSSYFWLLGNGSSHSGSQFNYVYTCAGSFSLNLQETNAVGCVASTQGSQIEVLPLPNATFTSNHNVICNLGDTLVVSPAAATTNYLWKHNGSIVSTGVSYQTSIQTAGNHLIELTAQSAFGCNRSSSQIIKATQALQPVLNIEDTAGCAPLTLEASLSGIVLSQLSWNTPNGAFTTNSLNTQIQSAGTYALSYVATDTFGCQFSDSYDSIHVLPSPALAFNLSDTSACDSLNLSLVVPSLMGVQHLWTVGTSNYSGDSVNLSFTELGSYDIQLKATDQYGCVDSLFFDQAVIIESALPLIELNGVNSCSAIAFQVEHNNPSLISSTWISNNDTVINASATFNYQSIGSYDLMFIGQSQLGCIDTSFFEDVAQVYQATVDLPNPSIVSSCVAAQVTLNADVLNASNVQWSFGDGTFSSSNVVTHSYTTLGTYIVSMSGTTVYGCTFNIDTHSIVQIGNPVPTFDYNILDCATGSVHIYSTTPNASAWAWSIGGQSFSDSSFVAYFPNFDFLSVTHGVTDDNGCASSITAINGLDLDSCNASASNISGLLSGGGSSGFTFNPTHYQCAPAVISFNHPLYQSLEIVYLFGDGDSAHTIGQAVHTYDSIGSYDLTIIEVDSFNQQDTLMIPNFIVIGQPLAAFNPLLDNFCGAGAVTVNNLSANSYFWNTSFGDGASSAAYSPSHTYDTAGFYTVSMVSSDTMNCQTSAHEMIAVDNPIIQLNIPDFACLGDSLEIQHTVSGFQSYTWHFDDSTFLGRLPIIALNDTGTFQLWLEGIDSNGCSTPFFVGTEISVADPQASFSFGSSSNACDGYNDTVQNTSTGASAYKWFLDGDFLSVERDFFLSIDDTGTYIIELKTKKYACLSTVIDTLMISKGTTSFDVAVSDSCLPATLNFTDVSPFAVSWSWDFGNGQSSTAQHPNVVFSELGADSIGLTTIDSNGCSSNHAIAPVAFLDVQVVANHSVFCFPAMVTFEDEVGDALQYVWQFSDTVFSGIDSVQVSLNDSGFVSITVDAIHASGCTTSRSFDSIIYVSKPRAAFTSSIPIASCAPLIASFTDESVGSIASYAWNFGLAGTSIEQNPQVGFNENIAYDVKLSVWDSIGCLSEILKPAEIHPSGPLADFQLLDNEVCMGDTARFMNTSIGCFSYLWVFSDGISETTLNASRVFELPGIIETSLLVYDSLGCSDVKTSAGLVVHAKPLLDFSILSDSVCLPVMVTLKDESEFLEKPTYLLGVNGQYQEVFPDIPLPISAVGWNELSLKIANQNGCFSDSLLEEKLLVFDTTAQLQPLLTKLNVTESGVEVAYEIGTEPNFTRAKLFVNTGTSWTEIAETSSQHLEALDIDAKAAQKSVCYKLQTESQCVKTKTINSIVAHCSIFLESTESNHSRTLEWTALENVDFSEYQILMRADSLQSYKPIGLVPKEITSYADSTERCPGEIQYAISAKNLSGKGSDSYSNADHSSIDTLPILLTSVDIDLVTVLDDEGILVEWKNRVGSSKLITALYLERKNVEGVRELVILDKRSTNYIDYDVDVQSEDYVYSIEALNVCQFENKNGLDANSMLLQVIQDQNELEFEWNSYYRFEKDGQRFELQMQDEFGNWKTIEKFKEGQLKAKVNLLDLED